MTNSVLKGELIGLNIEIVEAQNKSLVGIKGKIVDETKNTLKIRDKERTRTVLKSIITFIIQKQDLRFKIDGKKIRGRPEKRIK